ncbi:hypothetical protein OAF73_00790 [Planctomycetota bacterium]|nr:hypothetical protein [Planctomycetota bacterium]
MKRIQLTPEQERYKRVDSEFADAWKVYEAAWRNACDSYNAARKAALHEAESPEAAERILETVPLFEELPSSEGPIIKGENYLRTFFPKAEAAAEAAEVQALVEAEETKRRRAEDPDRYITVLVGISLVIFVLYMLFAER